MYPRILNWQILRALEELCTQCEFFRRVMEVEECSWPTAPTSCVWTDPVTSFRPTMPQASLVHGLLSTWTRMVLRSGQVYLAARTTFTASILPAAQLRWGPSVRTPLQVILAGSALEVRLRLRNRRHHRRQLQL